MDGEAESQEEDFSSESSEFKATKIVFYFIILTASLFGNSLLIYIICCTQSIRKRASSLLILNLALCDALTPLLSIPFDFALEENGYVWQFGGLLCHIIWPAATLTATCSSLTLATISFDRYRLLLHPFKPRLTHRSICLLIASNFIIGVAVVTPYVVVLDLEDGAACNETWSSENSRKAYTVVLFLAQYALPLLFMAGMYSLALKNLHLVAGRTWRMRSFKQKNADKESNNSNIEAKGPKRRLSRRLSNKLRSFHVEQTNIRATKMFIGIVVIFAIFMLPNQIIWLWSDFGGGQDHPDINQAKIICWLFTYTNSVLNPIIFTLFNRDFKRGVVKLTKKLCPEATLHRQSSSNLSQPQENVTRFSRFSAYVVEPGRLSDFYQISTAC